MNSLEIVSDENLNLNKNLLGGGGEYTESYNSDTHILVTTMI